MVKRLFAALLLLVVLAAAGLYAYTKLQAEYTVTYQSFQAATGSISNALSFSGSLQLINEATYTAQSDSTVRSVYAQTGDAVVKGQKLLRMSDGQTVEAQFSGRINKLDVHKDDEVTAGETLAQVADFSHLKVTVRIDEYDINDVSVGDACTVTATAIGKTYLGQIDDIDYISSATGNVAYYTTTVYVDVSEGDGVYPGMQATVSIVKEEAKDVTVLKMDALSFDRNNAAYVWMYNEAEELVQVPVTVGVSNGNYVEICEGIQAGDTVYAEVKTANDTNALFASMFGNRQMMMGGDDFSNRRNRSNDSGMQNGGFAPGGAGGESGGFPGGGGSR